MRRPIHIAALASSASRSFQTTRVLTAAAQDIVVPATTMTVAKAFVAKLLNMLVARPRSTRGVVAMRLPMYA